MTDDDADIPPDIRRELMDVATRNGRISYYWLCNLYRRGRQSSGGPSTAQTLVTKSAKNNGGSAFPASGTSRGMSLRDYFAAKAMAALLSNPQSNMGVGIQPGLVVSVVASRMAYEVADAMLEER